MRVSTGARFCTASAGHARRRLVSSNRQEHPLPDFSHALVIAGACHHGLTPDSLVDVPHSRLVQADTAGEAEKATSTGSP